MQKRANIIEIPATRAATERNRDEVFLTRPQLAERHQTTVETIKRRQAKGFYIAYKLGRTIRYKLSEIVAAENATQLASNAH
jgi:hypothetical protein